MSHLHSVSLSDLSLPKALFLGVVLLGPLLLWIPTLKGCARFFARLERQDKVRGALKRRDSKRQELRLSAIDN